MSTRTGGGRGEGEEVVNQIWTGLDKARGPISSHICADILYGWSLIISGLFATVVSIKKSVISSKIENYGDVNAVPFFFGYVL